MMFLHGSTLRVGIASYDQFKERTMAIVRGQIKPAADDPKVWFSSVKCFTEVVSGKHPNLLALIAETSRSDPPD